MYINLVKQRRAGPLNLSKVGDALTINGNTYDFSVLPEGGEVSQSVIPCDWFGGPVKRQDGVLYATIFIPWGPDTGGDTPMIHAVEDGPITIPEYDYDA